MLAVTPCDYSVIIHIALDRLDIVQPVIGQEGDMKSPTILQASQNLRNTQQSSANTIQTTKNQNKVPIKDTLSVCKQQLSETHNELSRAVQTAFLPRCRRRGW